MLSGIVALLSGACLVDGGTVELGERDLALTILHTSDIHSRMLPYTFVPSAPYQSNGLVWENAPFGGAAKLATIIKRERKKANRVIYVDSGDVFQGAPIFNVFSGEPEVRALAEMELDAFALGNHDFDLGADNAILQYGTWANFPIMAANWWTDRTDVIGNKQLGDMISQVVSLDVRGMRVLVIGLGNRSSMTSLGEGGNSVGVTPLDPHETLQAMINMWAPYVDVIVGLSHLGLNEDRELVRGSYRYVREEELIEDHGCSHTSEEGLFRCRVMGVRGLDVLLGGHHHMVLNPPEQLEDPDGRIVPLVHSGAFAQFVGRIDMVTRPAHRMDPVRPDWFRREVIDHHYQLFPVDSRTKPDAKMVRRLEPYVKELALTMDLAKPIAFAPMTIQRKNPQGLDSALGNVVADAIRSRPGVETDFVVTNSLGIRQNLYVGAVTTEDLFNVFPFENTITTLFLSGSEVQEMLQFVAARSTSRGCRSQVQVSGISFTMRCDCGTSSDGCCATATRYNGEYPRACAEDIRIGGQPLNPNGTYEMGSNDYMARGGSGFEMLRRNTTQRDTGIPLRTAVEEYMRTFPVCTEDYELGCSEADPRSPYCEYKYLKDNFGPPPCVVGEIEGRIQRRVSQ